MSWDEEYNEWDSLSGHSAAGYSEAMAEDNQRLCQECDTYYRGSKCRRCSKDEEDEHIEADNSCGTCEAAPAVTSFMDREVCWACYESLANGNHARDNCDFAHPGGNSALRAAGPGNPRVHPCPNCHASDVLTPQDVARGYQCDSCADMAENPWAP
jgi:hypothetical protein